jgi:uncharacterized protein (UPF0218 family)
MQIPEDVREALKKPLGALHRDFREIRKLSHSRRIISVGDVCTLGLLAMGIKPHLAVFDHLFMRRPLDPGMLRVLELHYRKPARYSNPPGTLSEKVVIDAPMLLSSGGGVLIDGEEDLTALAFILAAGPRDVIVYGQPGEGMVVVIPDKTLKTKIAGWLGIKQEG